MVLISIEKFLVRYINFEPLYHIGGGHHLGKMVPKIGYL